MYKERFTTIAIPKNLYKKLEGMKVHRRQPTYEILEKILGDGKDEKRRN